MGDKCLGIASAIAEVLEQEPEQLRDFINTMDTSSEYYQKTQALVEDIRWDNPDNIALLSVERRVSDTEMMYLFANTMPGNYAEAGLRNPLTPTRITAYETQRPVVGSEWATTQWGTLIESYYPVLDKNNNNQLLAIVGCKVSDAQYSSVMNPLLAMFVGGNLVIIALLVFIFFRFNRENKLLAEINEITRSAADAKSNFLASMSHEMRTPLNAVIGLSELSLSSGKLSGESADNVEKIYNSGVSLLGLVNDILDLSKIEAGKFEIVPANYDLPSLVNDTVNLNIMRIDEKPIIFNLELDDSLLSTLYGDELRVKQVFNNLLSNAFKYTKKGKVVWNVRTEREDDSVWLVSSVSDSGIGIRPEDIDKLFKDYNQVDIDSHRSIEGTGLGLSITKNLIAMMDGTIEVQSVYGEGTTFTVRLRQGFVNDVPIGGEVADNLRNFKYFDHKRDRSKKLVRVSLPYARVLIVDDVQVNLDVARGMMSPYNMQIDCVTSGKEAVELVRRGEPRYNAIFMDHMMPEMDGIEATRVIREEIGTDYAKSLPIIALTANALAGNDEMFLSKGFQAFLSKPIDIQWMDQVIRRWVRDPEIERELKSRRTVDAAGDEAGDGEVGEDTAGFGDAGGEGDSSDSDTTSASVAGVSIHIEGADLEATLERFAGDTEPLFRVLQSPPATTPPTLEKLAEATPESLDAYRIAVHGIKGASRNIYAVEIATAAQDLENAAREGDFAYISAHNQEFIVRVNALMAEIEALLTRLEQASARPLQERPDKNLLRQLRQAAEDFDMDGATGALEQILAFDYRQDGELVAWLKEQELLMDLDELASGLADI
ncbi:MAG: response regulator [Coriobacteriales bacterium]|nr:response regulator [Coriobacteriales bacterium]